MRQAIFQHEMLHSHKMQFGLAKPHAQLRGMTPEASNFVYEFWMHPKTLAAVSDAAEELEPVFDYEGGSFMSLIVLNLTLQD